MKRLSFLLLLFLGPTFVGTFWSCRKCKDSVLHYAIQSYESQLGKRTAEGVVPVAPRDTVHFSELEIILHGRLQFSNTFQGSGNWSAWACSPLEVPLDQIKSIKIISNQSYTTGLPAGSDLSDWVQVADEERRFQLVSEFLRKVPARPAELRFRFIHGPEEAGLHQFTILVDLGQSQSLTVRTELLYLNP